MLGGYIKGYLQNRGEFDIIKSQMTKNDTETDYIGGKFSTRISSKETSLRDSMRPPLGLRQQEFSQQGKTFSFQPRTSLNEIRSNLAGLPPLHGNPSVRSKSNAGNQPRKPWERPGQGAKINTSMPMKHRLKIVNHTTGSTNI